MMDNTLLSQTLHVILQGEGADPGFPPPLWGRVRVGGGPIVNADF